MSRKFRLTLKENFGFKVLSAFIAVIIVVLTIFTLFAVLHEGKKAKKGLREQGEMLAGLLSHSSRVGVFAENEKLLKDVAEGVLGQKYVAAVSIYNAGFKTLYAKDKAPAGKYANSINKNTAYNLTTAESMSVVETWNSFEFLKPVVIKPVSDAVESLYFDTKVEDKADKVIGYVRIVLSKDSYRKEILSVLSRNAFIMLIFIVSSVVIVYLAVQKVTRPLKKLTESVKALGMGIPVEQVPVETGDEIGNLASAFNAMLVTRRRAEDSLRESEERYRSLVELSPDAIYVQSGGKIVFINAAGVKLFGASDHSQLLGRQVLDLMHPDYRDIVKKRILHLDEERTAVPLLQEKYLRLDGTSVDVEVAATPFTFKGARAAQVIARDITERVRSEEFIKNVFESMGEGLVVIDREYKIVSANNAYLKRLKMSKNDVIGKYCYEVSHDNDKPCCELGEDCGARHTFDTGEPHAVVHVHRDEEGNPAYLETKTYPIKNASGTADTVIQIVNDITEKKRLEDQLRHAQKMEAVGQLAGGIAHDFNNILTAIIGYGYLLERGLEGNSSLQHFVTQILSSSEKAAHLTQGLLTFGRKQIINPRPINLNESVKNAENMLSRLIGENIEFVTAVTDDNLTVMADSGQIEQILMNLATNARDAMPAGGRLTVKTDRVELDDGFIKAHGYGQSGAYAHISVTDTGAGMDEKTKKRIFEPFFTTKEVGKGTGLGLSIVYGIVKQNNGYIGVSSEPGKGTTFDIYLPVISSDAKEAEPEEQTADMRGSETLLLAEDDEGVRDLTKSVLSEFGYTIIEAKDGEAAVEKLKRHQKRIQLLILDVIMPKKNGKEVFEEAKKIKPDVKVLFMSGHATDIIHTQAVLEEGLHYLSKPVSPKELLKKVREVLDM